MVDLSQSRIFCGGRIIRPCQGRIIRPGELHSGLFWFWFCSCTSLVMGLHCYSFSMFSFSWTCVYAHLLATSLNAIHRWFQADQDLRPSSPSPLSQTH